MDVNAHQLILVIDLGGQNNQLIARYVRGMGIYSEIIPYTKAKEALETKKPAAIIITDGPEMATDDAEALQSLFASTDIPLLGIGYGAALMTGTKTNIADIANCEAVTAQYSDHPLFKGLTGDHTVWTNKEDRIKTLPEGYTAIAETTHAPYAALANDEAKRYALQFHPEAAQTPEGKEIIENFLFACCGLEKDWTTEAFIEAQIQEIRETVGDKRVLCALSGGVDSSVAAVLIHRAIGDQLTCILVDHGLMRKNEADSVEHIFKDNFNIPFIHINAEDRFLGKLKGVHDPEQKRKIIGEEFVRVFEEEAGKIGKVDFLGQGTIYPDVIESGVGSGTAVIKSHHNVGGLPEDMTLKVLEPLRELFKDEVRQVGLALGIDPALIWRHPFPGPGLGIRVLGEVTKEKCDILREADAIYREELDKAGLTREIWQAFATLPDIRTVGVINEERTYCYMVGLRAVSSIDAMTADYYPIPHEILDKISRRIVAEVPQVNRVVFDITAKPPSTIEWE